MACESRRATDKLGHIPVAADDPIQGDKVSRLDPIRERDEISGEVLHTIAVALPFGLLVGDRHIGT